MDADELMRKKIWRMTSDPLATEDIRLQTVGMLCQRERVNSTLVMLERQMEEWNELKGRTCADASFRFEEGMYEDFLHTDLPNGLELEDIKLPFPIIEVWFEGTHYCATVVQPEGRLVMSHVDKAEHSCMRVWDSRGVRHVGEDIRFSWEAVLNALLYLASPYAKLDEQPLDDKLDRLRKALARAKSRATQEDLKGQIRKVQEAPKEIVVRRPEPALPTVAEGTGTKLSRRVRVRGHWRWQACGRRRSKRRLIYIAPFWRGPDVGEAIARSYRVDREDA